MKKKSLNKIWFLSLCWVCFLLTWCFHVPDEDWIFSENSSKDEDVDHEEQELKQSLNTLFHEFNMNQEFKESSIEGNDELVNTWNEILSEE